MKVEIVHRSDGSHHVHAADCSDLDKRQYAVDRSFGKWIIDADTKRDVVVEVYPPENFGYDGDDAQEIAGYGEDVKVFPCAAGLGR